MYGSGLLSSYGEIAHAIEAPEVQRFPIQLEWAINQAFEIDHYQPLLFIVDSFDHLFSLVDQLEVWMKAGKLNNVAPGEPGVNEEDLKSFLARWPEGRIIRNERVANSYIARSLLLLAGFRSVLANSGPEANSWKTSDKLGAMDLYGLSPAQKRAVLKLTREQDCSCLCGMKVAECVNRDPNCSYAKRWWPSRSKASRKAKAWWKSAS